MKKGLLIYKAKGNHKNIGDYIQSVAAEQYTGKDAIFIEREHLHEYTGEPVKLIMNGWYMHYPQNWPPSVNIIPLLTSIHITPNIGDSMLTEKGIDFFKKFGPVGCRDKGTQKLLKSKGIPAYFSGCLTLTLGKTFKHNPSATAIRFVDPYYETSKKPKALARYFFIVMKNRKIIRKIAAKLLKDLSFKGLIKTAAFYEAYSKAFEDEVLGNAEYLTHRIRESTLGNEESKFKFSHDLLQKYADSSLIITSRIHVTLPCIGIGTPVIFVISDHYKKKPTSKGRFDGIIELFNVMEYSDNTVKPVLGFDPGGKIGVNNSIKNKPDYLRVAEELDKSCTAFINANI